MRTMPLLGMELAGRSNARDQDWKRFWEEPITIDLEVCSCWYVVECLAPGMLTFASKIKSERSDVVKVARIVRSYAIFDSAKS